MIEKVNVQRRIVAYLDSFSLTRDLRQLRLSPSGVAAIHAESDVVIYAGEPMKQFQMSLILWMLSYVIGGVFRRSGWPHEEMSLWIQGVVIFLVVILPAGIGTLLGVRSLKHKEVKAWWAIGVIVMNIVMVLSGILLLSPD